MIRITQQKSAESARRCYSSADYCCEGRGIVGSWGGKGASRLGLNGTVDRISFRRLCDNLHPRSITPVTVRMRSKRTVGYHFIFSVSKSVSLLHAMSGDHAIVDAFRAAVDETMREMEGELRLLQLASGAEKNAMIDNAIGVTRCAEGGIESVQGERRHKKIARKDPRGERRYHDEPLPTIWQPVHTSRTGRVAWVAADGEC